MERRIRTLTCARLHMISSFLSDRSTCRMWLHIPVGSWLQDAGDGVNGSAFMRPCLISDGGAVNGLHLSRLNCYRIPARGLVTVLSPRVYAACWRFWLLDHDPSASAA